MPSRRSQAGRMPEPKFLFALEAIELMPWADKFPLPTATPNNKKSLAATEGRLRLDGTVLRMALEGNRQLRR